MMDHKCTKEVAINSIEKDVKFLVQKLTEVNEAKEKEDGYIRELLDTKFDSIIDRMTSNHAILIEQNKEMIHHQKITNGRINRAEEHIEDIFGKMDSLKPTIDELLGYSNFIRWMKKNPAKTVLITAFILFAISAAVDLIGFKSIIDYIK
jgi:hypothetical protein